MVVGAQRAGTTSLFRVLSEHPYLCRPTQDKGVGYFDLNYGEGRAWYRAHFPLRLWRRKSLAFESSGYYLFHPAVPKRLARDLPHVKIVVLVRDPVERAMSAHRHELARGFETEPFDVAVELEETRLEGEEERLASDPTYQSFEHRHHGYLARGKYCEQIQRFIDAIGRDQVFIMDADRFFASPEDECEGLYAWLGVPVWHPDAYEQWNARPNSRGYLAEDLASLAEYFAPYDAELARQMGRLPSWNDSEVSDAEE